MERSQPPPTWQTGPRFLSEDFLRPHQQHALGPRREKARRTRGECAQASGCLGRSGRGGKRRTTPGERAPKPLAAWAAQAGEGTTRRRNRIRAFVEDTKTGTAINAGPAPYRAAGSLSSVDGESTDTSERGKPSVAGTRRVLPTHSDICLQRPALPPAGLN